MFEHVGTDLKGVVRSNNVGTAVLPKKWISKQIGVFSGLVCPVGTVGQENSVLEKKYEVRSPMYNASLTSQISCLISKPW